jgi:YggT family protein
VIAQIISATALVLTIAIIARALMSWFPNLDRRNPLVDFLFTITEPVLAPIRSVMPRGMMIDFSPMIAIVLIQAISRVLLSGAG